MEIFFMLPHFLMLARSGGKKMRKKKYVEAKEDATNWELGKKFESFSEGLVFV